MAFVLIFMEKLVGCSSNFYLYFALFFLCMILTYFGCYLTGPFLGGATFNPLEINLELTKEATSNMEHVKP